MDDIKTPGKDKPPATPQPTPDKVDLPSVVPSPPKGGKTRRRKTRKGKKNPKTKRRS